MSQVVGLTGIIGTGKTTAAKYMADKYKFQIIDVDAIGHEFLAEEKVAQQISKELGTVDRKKLGEIVFKDPVKLNRLNEILHPLMYKRVKKEIEILKQANEDVLVEAALLYQIGLDAFCDKVICLQSTPEKIVARLRKKGLDQKAINERLANAPEIPAENLISVENNAGLAELKIKLDIIFFKQ